VTIQRRTGGEAERIGARDGTRSIAIAQQRPQAASIAKTDASAAALPPPSGVHQFVPPAGGNRKDGPMDGENPRDSRALLERHVLEGGLQRENLIRCRRSLALRVRVFEWNWIRFCVPKGKMKKTRFVAGQTLIARAGN